MRPDFQVLGMFKKPVARRGFFQAFGQQRHPVEQPSADG